MTIANRLRDFYGRLTGDHHRATASLKQVDHPDHQPRPMTKGQIERALDR